MQASHDLVGRALASRIVAIVRLARESPLVEIAEALVEGGLRTIEFTLTTPGALDAVSACRARFGDRALIGAGTVLDAADARRCTAAGAQLVVAPDFNPEVVAEALRGGALAIPGALTPTEIVTAWRSGASLVKVFPARALGPQYIADILAPLPHILLMATGGVHQDNVAAFVRAGAAAVAVGGNLVDRDVVERRDWRALSERARSLVDAVREL